jgi:hypothetical protein
VIALISGGDTAFFGAGEWFGVYIEPPAGNSNTDKTVYACSTYSLATAHNTTTLWSGDSVGDWILHSGNIYKAKWTPSDTTGDFVGDGNNYLGPPVVGGDSIYWPRPTLGGVTAAGYCYYSFNTNADTLYIWPYISGDPDTSGHRILASATRMVHFPSDVEHIEFWGLGLKMGFNGVVQIHGAVHTDSVYFIHCNIAHASNEGHTGNNNSSIIWAGGYGEPDHKDGIQFVACSLYSATSSRDVYDSGAGSGCTAYANHNMVFDSCYFKLLGGAGVHFKGGPAPAQCIGSAVRYSVFDGSDSLMPYGRHSFSEIAVDVSCNQDRDSVYGNIFMNLYHKWAYARYQGSCGSGEFYMGDFICNNTIYNCAGFILALNPTPYYPDSLFVMKYNVMQETFRSDNYWLLGTIPITNSSYCDIDSNYYHDSNSNFVCRESGVASRNWTYWTETWGYDANGDTLDVTFDSVGAVNPWLGLKRTGASGEMNRTYGGRTWTIFGAVQNDGGSGPSKAPFLR